LDPLFIVVEGIDGAGSTTASKELVACLTKMGHETVWTKEPSGGTIGRHIRRILKKEETADELAMFPMFLADRHDHLCNVVRPELKTGNIVVCDRYAYSTWVYQQDNYDRFLIEFMQRHCEAPDFVFVLDCSVKVAMERIGKRDVIERYEIEEKQVEYAKRYRFIPRIGQEKIHHMSSEDHSVEELVDLMILKMGLSV
jgi:dTMP kinase